MSGQNKVSGVVLAGGLARRMGQRDKGLVAFNNRPLISYALTAMAPLTDDLLISANRHQDVYRQFGYPVIGDNNPTFEGPLAGILAAMCVVRNPVLLVVPCDSPLFETGHLQRLLDALAESPVDIAVAFDGKRLHPVFAALNTSLRADLQAYLQRGERKLESWFDLHSAIRVDFSETPEIFANINTPAELLALENFQTSKLT